MASVTYTKAKIDELLNAKATVAHRPVNVMQTGAPLADAVGDGGSHPLSERFGSLTDAQAVFPRATALTEEIDRHALQLALDNFSDVYAHDGTYLLDKTVYTSGADTPRGLGNQSFIMAPGALLTWRDGITVSKFGLFASGNAKTVVTQASPDSVQAPDCPNLTLVVRVDGKQGLGLVTNQGMVAGVCLFHCSDLDLTADVIRAFGDGIFCTGVTDADTRGATIRKIKTSNNGNRGLAMSLRTRMVTYLDVKAHDNGGTGVFFDHSESTSVSIQSWDNGGTGIWAHNFTRNEMRGFRATGNAQHGILVSGSVASEGGGWVATDNGSSGAQYDDVHFDATSGSYGLSRESRFHDIVCGRYIGGIGLGHALFVEDGLSDTTLKIAGVLVPGAEGSGDIRIPATWAPLA